MPNIFITITFDSEILKSSYFREIKIDKMNNREMTNNVMVS